MDKRKKIELLHRLKSIQVRLEETDDSGWGQCVTCKHSYEFEVLQCGHYIKREHNAVTFRRENLGAQCPECNTNHFRTQEMIIDYATHIDCKYGEEIRKELERMKNTDHKIDEAWLDAEIKRTRYKCQELASEKMFIVKIP